MRHLYAERKSGTLHLSREGIERRVHFKKGVAIFADSDDHPPGSPEEAERLLQSLFSWTSGELSFVEGEPTVDELRAFTASPSVVILEGSRRIDDRQTLEYLVGGPASIFACTESSVLPLFTMKLSPEESAILKFARERERFASRDLPFASDDLTVVRALNALVSIGLLEITEKAVAPMPEPATAVPPPAPDPSPVEPPPIPFEVESLLDTFEAKRSTVAPPSPSPDRDGDLAAVPVEAALPDLPPTPRLDPRAEPEPKNVSKAAPSPSSIRPPKRNGHTIAVAGLAVVAAGAGLGIWFFARGNEAPRRNPVVSADSPSTESEPGVSQLPPTPPTAPEAEDESRQDVQPPPSEAELFYSANLAFENGNYEQSKTELTALLERQPDFAPARELMARINRELSGKKRAAEPRKPPAKVVAKAPEPEPKAEPVPPPKPAPPDPTTLLGEARTALDGGDLENRAKEARRARATSRVVPRGRRAPRRARGAILGTEAPSRAQGSTRSRPRRLQWGSHADVHRLRIPFQGARVGLELRRGGGD